MRNGHDPKKTRRGFTILELLVVISIMAVIATLVTGAAIKAIKQSRNKRVEATRKAREMALVNYRAQENEWPFKTDDGGGDLEKDTQDVDARLWAHGADNLRVFKKLYENAGIAGKTVYIDASAVMVEAGGRRMTLKAALDSGRSDARLGFPSPDDQSKFAYYCVCYNPATQSVSVHRQDQQHARKTEAGLGKKGFWCPQWNTK